MFPWLAMDNSTAKWNGTFRDVDFAYVAVTSFVALTSMVASVTVPVCLLMYPDVCTVGRRLLAFLASATFILALGNILQAATYFLSSWRLTDGGAACVMAAVVWVYGDVASSLLTDLVALYVLLTLAFRQTLLANRLVPVFTMLAWAMPAVVVASALNSEVFGYEVEAVAQGRHPTWCWVSDRVGNRWGWQMLTSEGWALGSFIFLVIAHVITALASCCRRRRAVEQEETVVPVDKQLRYVPVVYVFLRFWPTAFTMTYHGSMMAPRTLPNEGLLLMKGLFGPAQGIFVALLFFSAAAQLRRRLAYRMGPCCRCCKRRPDPELLKKWTPSMIVRKRPLRKKPGSDLDLSGISFDLPGPGEEKAWEDEVIFERGHRVDDNSDSYTDSTV